MAKDLLHQHLEKFKDSFQSGLNSIQQAVQQQTTTLVGSSNFYPTTLVLQTALKSGWLKKLSNVMKHWQRRWFVIKGDNLYYYSSHNDTKPPQGCVFLPCCHVAEQVSKGSDCDKFVFTILPDDSNNYNQESFVLAADSDQERNNWMRIIKKIIYKRHGGAIFGSSLEETLRFETRKNPGRTVPEIVEICIEYLRKHGLNEEGLFRLPGLTSMIKKCVELFDRGERPRFEDIPSLDVHTVSSLLKLYIRELPSSLISADLYEGVVRFMREMPLDPKTSMENLRKLLLTLTKSNYHLLKYLCTFLSEVSKNSATNRMNSHNLSTVFSTAFLRPEFGDDDAALMMATSEARKAVTFVIIENQEWLFNFELTPFGGTVVIEDLLGFKFDDDNTTTHNNYDDVSNSSSSNNSHSDKEFGRKSPQINEETFKDLLEIDFSGKVINYSLYIIITNKIIDKYLVKLLFYYTF
ncbi:hypothetical protein HELRODRAFT_96714 [Helobdella robusta]|uniref:Uncharacterized protein n=1 Tax=Helobdella robusta TaxID=6412 RepID=T1G9D3_HELRO|nr:hypothetical protein HELRODRAFT_96714 [Helobdella robusta]ESO11521.1 hypothetical protein HELRODRAFT_96714 [Helobdella robusta]